jgi:hypothetical protein
MRGRDDDLPFRIELWDDGDSRVEEVIALASDFSTGRRLRRGREAAAGQAHHASAEAKGD